MSKVEVNQISSQCGSTLTIGQSGDTVQLASGATQTGFGRTGTVDWDTTVKTAAFTAVSGNGYFCNTTSSNFTVTLPASPSAGDIISIADYASTFETNPIQLGRNGSKIGGEESNVFLQTNGQSVTLVYIDSTEGWVTVNDSTNNVSGSSFIVATGGTVTTCGDCKIHTFTGPGTFTVLQVHPSAPNNTVDYTVVGGGAAGGFTTPTAAGAGGGGAGGYRASGYGPSPLQGTAITATVTSYPITVGAGGAAGSPPGESTGNSGSVSTFSTITSAGGGGGAGGPPSAGVDGGSGGGGQAGQAGGSGNTPPVSPSQGNNGGTGWPGGGSHPSYGGGGGGGATENGVNGAPNGGGRGGAGVPNAITGSALSYAGGGGGGSYVSGAAGAASPCGTGGVGARGNPGTVAGSGTTNRGGGGGGSNNSTDGSSGAGGSGVVILRYKFQ